LWVTAVPVSCVSRHRTGKVTFKVPHRTAEGDVQLRVVAYRRESRVEVIVAVAAAATASADGSLSGLARAVAECRWDELEAALLTVLK
jgi:hypothetical protein